jgi:hypothetical protein
VTLHDTARDAKEPVLARTALSSAYSGGSSSRPLQLTKLASPTTAGDGTPEPLLVSLPQYGPELNGRFQLLTLSDHTLTTRAAIDQRGTAEGIALFGRTLVTVSSTQLSTFDARDLNAAVELGQVELAENYRHVFGFGEHVVRIREHPSVLAPEERGRRVQDDLQVLRRSDGQDVIASLPVESVGTWLQVGPVLVNAQLSVAEYGDEYTRKARVAIQAYDLSDPGAHL